QIRLLVDFCWPVAFAVAFNWAHMQGYRFLLAEHGGFGELGIFAAGYGVAAALLAAMEMVLATKLQPEFYRQANHTDEMVRNAAWRNYAQVLVPASVLGVAAVITAAPDLASVMLGPAYRASSRYVALGACAEWARVMVGVFVLNAHLHMNTRSLIVPNFCGALLTLVCIAILLPRWGLSVAPIAAMLGGLLVMWVLYSQALGRHDEMHLDWSGISKALLVAIMLISSGAGWREWVAEKGWEVSPLLSLSLLGLIWLTVIGSLFRNKLIRPLMRESL
ncbi:MAG TPA: hypothetical protein VFW00_10510, partial [Rhodocyclaceae bacterium]|nr:hypothetical protein [Rhodocyclaceae bacterium]